MTRPSVERQENTVASAPQGIGDTYQLLAKLSEGGMGAIYKVRHRHLGQRRVIKVMRPHLEDDEGFQARFLREAQLEAEMKHPNIAQLYDFAVTPAGVAYMVIEYIDGLTLQEVLRSSGPPSIALGLEIARQSLDALTHLHDSGFVHRDISPDNLMLTRGAAGRLHLKLIDLGIAKKVEEPSELQITKTGTFIGKVRYASPEQFGGKRQLDYRSDLYSFGVVLYELLTGRYPIWGDDTSSIIAGHLFRPPLPFAETDPEGRVPEDLRAAILRALEKGPDERFPTAAEFAGSLARIQARVGEARQAEVGQLFELGSETFPAVPDHSTVAGREALWQLLEEGPGEAGSPAGRAEASALSPSGVERVAAPWARPRPRRLLAAGAAVAALALGVGTLPRWWPGSETGVEIAGGLEARAPITEPMRFGRYYALVIGNNAYQGGLQPLHTAVGDAQAVADLLADEYGFIVNHLVDATYEEIRTAVDNYRFELTPEDNLLIYYAGHGRLEGETGYWLPVDAEEDSTANWVSNRDVSETLLDVPAKHVLVIADSCYSGTLSGAPTVDPQLASSEQDRVRYIREKLSRKARLALTSGGEVPVLDSGSGGHSVFTSALLSILQDNSDVLEASALYSLLQHRVSAAVDRLAVDLEPGYSQEPEYAPIPAAGDDGGEFFFAPSELQAS